MPFVKRETQELRRLRLILRSRSSFSPRERSGKRRISNMRGLASRSLARKVAGSCSSIYAFVRESRFRTSRPRLSSPNSKLAGVVTVTPEGRLTARNRIYEAVFTAEWARSAIPVDRGRQLVASTLGVALVGALVWYVACRTPTDEPSALPQLVQPSSDGGHIRR